MTPGPKYCHFPLEEERGYNKDYFHGLLSERLVYLPERKIRGSGKRFLGTSVTRLWTVETMPSLLSALDPDLDVIATNQGSP